MSTTNDENLENEKATTETQETQSPVVETPNSEIKLNFINESNDMNNSNVVIYQKNVASDFDDIAVAWKVIKNCGRGWQHPFSYPLAVDITASDAYGNLSFKSRADEGQKWQMTDSASGIVLELIGTAVSTDQIELQNSLAQGSVNANVYRDGKLVATKTDLVPMQKAIFQFRPTLYIGVVSQVMEGQIMNSAIVSDIDTEISLEGITEADIIMTGGGIGQAEKPFQFHLVPK